MGPIVLPASTGTDSVGRHYHLYTLPTATDSTAGGNQQQWEVSLARHDIGTALQGWYGYEHLMDDHFL